MQFFFALEQNYVKFITVHWCKARALFQTWQFIGSEPEFTMTLWNSFPSQTKWLSLIASENREFWASFYFKANNEIQCTRVSPRKLQSLFLLGKIYFKTEYFQKCCFHCFQLHRQVRIKPIFYTMNSLVTFIKKTKENFWKCSL